MAKLLKLEVGLEMGEGVGCYTLYQLCIYAYRFDKNFPMNSHNIILLCLHPVSNTKSSFINDMISIR